MPRAAHESRFAVRSAIRPLEHHGAVANSPFDGEQLSVVCYPGLMPSLPRAIIDAETLALVPVDRLVDFVKNATIQNQLNYHVCDFLARLTLIIDVPVAGPEIKSAIQR